MEENNSASGGSMSSPDETKESHEVLSESKPNRREFLTRAIIALSSLFAVSIIYPIGKFLRQPSSGGSVKRTVAAATTELANDSAKIFRFGSSPGILIRKPDGNFKAFSAVCTHLDCTVQYVPGEKHILCACHDGKYDLNGQVISGPPPRALEEFKVDVKNDEIIVTRT